MRQIALLFSIIFLVNVTVLFSFTSSFAQGTASAEMNVSAAEYANQNVAILNAEDSDDANETDKSDGIKVLENNKMYFSIRSYSFQGKVMLEQDSFLQLTIGYWKSGSLGPSYAEVYYEIYIYLKDATDVSPLIVSSYYGRTYPQFLSAGEYYIIILPHPSGIGMDLLSFYLYASYSASEYYETEDNSSVEHANDIEPGCLIRGNLRSANDEDWYVFDIPSKKRVTITLKHNELDEETDSNVYWHYELFDSNLNSITSNNVGGLVSEKSSKSELGAGTYYICVSSGIYTNAQYQIEVSVKNPSIWSYTWTWVIVGIVAVIFVVGSINYIRVILKRKA